MKHNTTLLLSALFVPALFAFGPRSDQVTFQPEEGLSVTRAFTSETQISLDDFSMSMNGQPFPMEMEMEMDMTMNLGIEVTDEFVAMSDGKPVKLRRGYDTIGSNGTFAMEMAMMPGGGDEKTIAASSELEGKTVLFTWNEDDGAYDVAYDESEGDEELLEDLEEDMDLRVLLPEGEVAEGDTWEIDVKGLASMLMPGGDVKLVPDDMEEEMDMMPGMDKFGDWSDMLGDLLEGNASGEYKGTTEVDGVKVGVIAISISISSSNDMTEKIEEVMDEMPDGVEDMSINHVDIELEMEGEGTLHWDLEGGLAHSFEISGTMNTIMDMGMSVSAGDQNMDIEQTMEMSGDFNSSLAISRD